MLTACWIKTDTLKRTGIFSRMQLMTLMWKKALAQLECFYHTGLEATHLVPTNICIVFYGNDHVRGKMYGLPVRC